jgi:hypothetical protein
MRELADQLEALWNRSTPGRWTVYSSNSWRRIGMEGPFKEIIYPVRHAGDGHPDLSGPNVDADLALLMALRNAVPEILKALRAEAMPNKHHLLVAEWLEKRDATYSAALIRRYYESDPPAGSHG